MTGKVWFQLVDTKTRVEVLHQQSGEVGESISSVMGLAEIACPVLAVTTGTPGSFLHISEAYTAGSGLTVEGGLLLYQRQEVMDEWMAISTYVVQTYARLWIVGPPGTGKSCAAFAFACSLKRVDDDLNPDWDVLWIHRPVRQGAPLQCILFRGQNEKWTCVIDAKTLDTLLALLSEKAFVFLDGYVKKDENVALDLCEMWRVKNKKCCRLVVVTSMVSMGKDWRPEVYQRIPSKVTSSLKSTTILSTVSNTDKVKDEQLFELTSWTLDDYQNALKNDAFFDHVKLKFGVASMVSIEERMELLKEKFYCCWWDCANDVFCYH